MKSLSSIESVSDFALAIASGADVNGVFRGHPLVEYYFVECMRKTMLRTQSPDEERKKLALLLACGADVTPLFKSPYETYEWGNLVRLTTRYLELLRVILESEQARKLLKGDGKRLSELKTLFENLDRIVALEVET